MRRPSVRSVIALGAGAAALLIAVRVAADYSDSRSDLYHRAAEITGGDPHRGEAMFIQYGCGGCHNVIGVRRATGLVGPPLDGVALRAIIAGRLANRPANLQKWIRDPQQVSPGTAMPDLDVGEEDARDISAFLYTRN
jgi:cytochrome c2